PKTSVSAWDTSPSASQWDSVTWDAAPASSPPSTSWEPSGASSTWESGTQTSWDSAPSTQWQSSNWQSSTEPAWEPAPEARGGPGPAPRIRARGSPLGGGRHAAPVGHHGRGEHDHRLRQLAAEPPESRRVRLAHQ